jgi:amidophosphoribosyltransferase
MLREAGAREVHMRISSPPIAWPCFYGIDMPSRTELVAASQSIEEIARMSGATSLAYLSLEGLQLAIGKPAGSFCRACFTGEYPIPVPDSPMKLRFEQPEPQPAGA